MQGQAEETGKKGRAKGKVSGNAKGKDKGESKGKATHESSKTKVPQSERSANGLCFQWKTLNMFMHRTCF